MTDRPAKAPDVREARLVIAEHLNRRDNLSGAWWPRSRLAGQELPTVLRAATRRFRLVLGITLNLNEWPGTDIAVDHVGGLRTKVSWYGLPEANLAVLYIDGARRINLLVVPPETPESVALSAMLAASTPGNRSTPQQLLTAAAAEHRK